MNCRYEIDMNRYEFRLPYAIAKIAFITVRIIASFDFIILIKKTC